MNIPLADGSGVGDPDHDGDCSECREEIDAAAAVVMGDEVPEDVPSSPLPFEHVAWRDPSPGVVSGGQDAPPRRQPKCLSQQQRR